MLNVLLIILLFISQAYAVTTTTYNGSKEDATWTKTALGSDARNKEADSVDQTLSKSQVEYSDIGSGGNFRAKRSIMVWDLTGIPAHSLYVVNAKVQISNNAAQPVSDSSSLGITRSFMKNSEGLPGTRSTKEFQYTRDPIGDSPDSFTEIANRRPAPGKGTTTFTIYQNQLSDVIQLEAWTEIGIHHEYDLDNIDPTGTNQLVFFAGENASPANRPNLLLTTCNNCVHILGNTQIFGGQIK